MLLSSLGHPAFACFFGLRCCPVMITSHMHALRQNAQKPLPVQSKVEWAFVFWPTTISTSSLMQLSRVCPSRHTHAGAGGLFFRTECVRQALSKYEGHHTHRFVTDSHQC